MSKIHAKGIIFDYGGTLDTRGRHWAHVLWEGYQQAQVPVTQEQFRTAYVHAERALARERIVLPEDDFLSLMRKKVNLETSFLAENGVWLVDHTTRQARSETVAEYCYEQARATVTQSRETLCLLAPHYPMALVSNFYGNIGTILRDFNLEGFFPHVIESAVVGVRKPDPAIYQMGVDALALPAEDVVVVGDSYDKDILPAKAIGCQAVWMEGEGWNAAEPADTSVPDAVITDLRQLADLLL